PVTFENPLYSTVAGPSSDPAVIHATQVTVNMAGEQIANNYENPVFYTEQPVKAALEPSSNDAVQTSKWGFFKRKWKPSTTFENPTYSEMQNERVASGGDDGSSSQPSPFNAPAKVSKERPSAYTPTEDTFHDTANLVKEDSDI
ncbi:hypothetical protein JZ751_029492, partial [Albula glossodonta]